MKIQKQILQELNKKIADMPPETGGILGSKNGVLIEKIVIDRPNGIDKYCSYAPNVDFLNQALETWQKRNICFMGVFHTHFFGVKTLSEGDKNYITLIMQSMPKSIESLYFPIYLLPDRELVCYCAVRKDEIVEIYKEDLIIVN